jgi:hypothetical protein
MMYPSEDENNPIMVLTKSFAQLASLASRVFGLFKDVSQFPYTTVPPMDVDVVARATIAATLNPSIRGIVEGDNITLLASER